MFTGDDRYMVPTYQRGYSWKPEHVSQFLLDLEYVNNDHNNIHEHFFGSVLITKPGNAANRIIKIIDGQQRLTTATLFLMCARNFFESHQESSTNASDYYRRMNEYIYASSYNADPDSNQPVLTLSRPNNMFFRDLLNHHSISEDVDSVYSESNDSNELLANAYKEIRVWMEKESHVDTSVPEDQRLDLAIRKIYRYVRTLIGKFVIYKYYYNDESEAYRIFNLVNNRGIRLNDSDLIKNYLFGKLETQHASSADIDAYDEQWDQMRQQVTNKQNSDYKLDRFFYHYLLAFHSSELPNSNDNDDQNTPSRLKQKQIYESFEHLVDEKNKNPKTIIEKLRDLSQTLSYLRNPNGHFTKKDNIIHYLKKIKSVNAVFVYPAIIAGYETYWKHEDYKSFEALVMLCFKYHIRVKVIGTSLSLSEYQGKMYDIMDQIQRKDSIKQIITELVLDDKFYPDRERVLLNLNILRVSNSKLTLALLEEAEYAINRKRSPDDVSIEHIMPKKFKPWEQYIIANNPDVNSATEAEDLHDHYFNMLGNQTLLSGKDNTSISNKSFEIKKEEYANHKTFAITTALCDIPVWHAESISNRQNTLAEAIVDEIDLSKIIIDLNL